MKKLLLICFSSLALSLQAQYQAKLSLFPEVDSLHANEPIRATYCLFVNKKVLVSTSQQEKFQFEFIENGHFRRTVYSDRFLGRTPTQDSFCYTYILTPMRQGAVTLPTGRFVQGTQLLASVEAPIWIKETYLRPEDSLSLLQARQGSTNRQTYLSPPQVANEALVLPLALEAEKSQYQAKVGERLAIKYILNRSSENWTIPKHPAFRLMTVTKGYSIRLSQGQSAYITTRTLHLLPQTVGNFELPSCQVVFEGDSIRSEVVKIIVIE